VTFRGRLTLSYAIASASSLTVLALAVCVAAGFVLTHSISLSERHTADDVRAVVWRDAKRPLGAIAADVRTLRVPDDVVVRVNLRPMRFHHLAPPGPPPGPQVAQPGAPGAPPAPPGLSAPPGAQPGTTAQGRVVAGRFGGPGRQGPPGMFNAFGLMGLSPIVVPLPGRGDVFVAPNLARLAPLLRVIALGFLGFELVAILLSWFVGRRIADRAMRPLDAIRAELERFGRGDFSPRAVRATAAPDLDALVGAYNAAAAQVASAFAERARVESEMRLFLAEAGHQMRTPLTVISGSLDLLFKRGANDAAIREATYPLMRTQTARLRRLVERIMRLASLERAEPAQGEVVDVAEIARDVVDAANALRAGHVVLSDDGTFTYVWANRDELQDALGNLVENGVKYGRGNVRVDVVNEDESVVVRVADDGPGIAEPDRKRLFERFFRGENAAEVEGTGLGLAIARRAAERAGGSVGLESTTARGSTFRLVIPAFRETARERTPVALG